MPSVAALPDARLDMLTAWAASAIGTPAFDVDLASADASFRRYFRLTLATPWRGHPTLIVMDAPPPKEDCQPFVRVAHLLAAAGLHAPAVFAEDLTRGFLLLSDLGDRTYLAALDAASASRLYSDATDALIRWQRATRAGELPPYDEALLTRELNLFPDWYIARLEAFCP